MLLVLSEASISVALVSKQKIWQNIFDDTKEESNIVYSPVINAERSVKAAAEYSIYSAVLA